MLHRSFSFFLAVILIFPGTSQAQEEPGYEARFKIGFILTETGPWAEYGQSQRIALEMARQERPELFERIAFIYEDCQYQAKNAVAAFNKLKNIDQVDLIFVWGVEPAHVVAPLAERARFPLIVSAIDASSSRGRRFVVRTINFAEQYALALVKYFQSHGIKKIGIISSELSFHNMLIDGIRKNLSKDQTLEVIANLLPHDNDLNSVVTRLKNKEYDSLGLFLNPGQIIQYYRHAKAQGVSLPVFGIQTFQSKTLVSAAAGQMEGAIFPHNLVRADFAEAFLKRAGDDMQLPWAANAYDFAVLAGEILSALREKPASEKMVELFRSIKPREGAGGSFRSTYRAQAGYFYDYPIAVKQIKNSSFRVIAEFLF